MLFKYVCPDEVLMNGKLGYFIPEGIAKPGSFNNWHVKELVLSNGHLLAVLSEHCIRILVLTVHERISSERQE